MPSELVEEVWEEMCAKYRSGSKDRPLAATLPSSSSVVSQNKEEVEVEEVAQRWELMVHHTHDLEDRLSAWSWEENGGAKMTSLVTHAQWLISKNQLDKVRPPSLLPPSLSLSIVRWVHF
jgi:hypothetical protein